MNQKFAVVSVVNGNFFIDAEKGEDLQGAFVFWANRISALWNAQDVETAVVKVVDQNFNVVDGHEEHIVHPIVEPVE